MHRTTISHFSFLISNSSEAFIRNQDCPRSLPFPIEACMEKTIKDALLFEKTKNGLTQQMMIQILFFICVPVFSALVLPRMTRITRSKSTVPLL